ncbi:hypothetical protein S7335_892 [Synechococcus sp. PCC 7335]|uniref:hypothetical protein n=1 Tax=Synechococcus sp. (strain ATCC 29403 / PCC 7335) TaxID=91464 RepID=UPI00017EC82F|nr:hypothetical protein [Synechococcus sp. PCC 7335]EDX82335.1 hypothetical protein S7335_892 [Synechococcus sp. PCC 7335]
MRVQIRARVEQAEWEALRQGAESNTELLARIVQEWQEQKAVLSALTEIAPSPMQALGRLLLSYELLQRSSVSIHPPKPPSVTVTPPAASTTPAPTIGGLENNSDDW